jgi:uncharacterized protein YgiM (DUF1202 family)
MDENATQKRTRVLARWVKLIIPWILLLVVISNAWGITEQYRQASHLATRQGSVEVTAPVVATETPKPATPRPAADAKPKGTVVVLVDGLSLRVDPSATAAITGTVHKDERLVLLQQRGSWYFVMAGSGRTGWVTANARWTRLEKR